MNASKVSFFQHTKEQLNARPLSQKHKMKLRRQRVIEFIRELPYGECQKADLIAAAGWDIADQKQYSTGWSFIERLRKNKVIRMSDGTNPKNTYIKKWEVVADIRTVEPRKSFEEIVSTPMFPDMPKLEPVIMPDEPVTVPDDLLEQAKTFAWNTNSDSLREFVAWVKR